MLDRFDRSAEIYLSRGRKLTVENLYRWIYAESLDVEGIWLILLWLFFVFRCSSSVQREELKREICIVFGSCSWSDV